MKSTHGTWIGIRISTHLIPDFVWLSGYDQVSGLERPARDALDIERRWRKEVMLRNEARRYTACCERIQSLVLDLARVGAPIPPPVMWRAYDDAGPEPSAVAYLAICEYLRRVYTVQTAGERTKSGLKDKRLEAIFHPPGEWIAKLSALVTHVAREPKAPQIYEAAAVKAEVSMGQLKVSGSDCRHAFEQRVSLVTRCVQENFGLVDVFDVS